MNIFSLSRLPNEKKFKKQNQHSIYALNFVCSTKKLKNFETIFGIKVQIFALWLCYILIKILDFFPSEIPIWRLILLKLVGKFLELHMGSETFIV